MSSSLVSGIASAYLQTTRLQVTEEVGASILKTQAETGMAIAEILEAQAALLKSLTYDGGGSQVFPVIGTTLDTTA